MDTIKFLIKYLFKLAIVLILAYVLLLVISNFYPSLSFRNFVGTMTLSGGDWLPAPGSLVKLSFPTPKTPSSEDNVFTYGNNVTGSQVDYVTYTGDGMQIVHTSSGQNVNVNMSYGNAASSYYESRAKYIRNLSIYEGGHIYTGISFYGEAKSSMFQNGTFPIIIADNTGRIISISTAEAMSTWSVPGWTRFYVKINAVLPDKIHCTMVFQSAGSYTTAQPTRVAIPVLCN